MIRSNPKISEDIKMKINDRDWIYDQYVNKDLSLGKIARNIGVTRKVITNRVKKFKITKSVSSSRQINEDRLDKLNDSGYFIREYIKERKSIKDIAKDIDICSETLRKYFKKKKIERPSTTFSDEVNKKLNNREWLEDEYVKKKNNVAGIARDLGVPSGVIYKRLERHGLKVRPRLSDLAKEKLNDPEWLRHEHLVNRKTIVDIA